MAFENHEGGFVAPPLGRTTTGFTDRWKQPDKAWKKANLLSLDGGGIRGYWSLLVLNKLIEQIAHIEQALDENVDVGERAGNSFHPEEYPENVSQNLSQEETRSFKGTKSAHRQKFEALNNNRRYLPCHYFDYICGSSTGSLIAIMLGRFRMTVFDCLHEYESLASEIFGKPRSFTKLNYKYGFDVYNTKKVEEVFKQVVNRRCDVSESKKDWKGFASRKKVCKTFSTSLVSECQRGENERVRTKYLIRSYDHRAKHAAYNHVEPLPSPSRVDTELGEAGGGRTYSSRNINYGPAEPMEVWQVARAATAAPLYFKPFDGPMDPQENTFKRFVDGGLHLANNPTWEGVQEVEDQNGYRCISLVLSVGTARTNERPGSSLKKQVKNIIELGNDPQTVHEQVERESRAGYGDFFYFRFNDPDGTEVAMDECEPRKGRGTTAAGSTTLQKLRTHCDTWFCRQDVRTDLWRCTVLLVKQRRARTNDPGAWESFSTGSEYRCPTGKCEDINVVFLNKYELQDHMREEHHEQMAFNDERISSQRDVWEYQEGIT